MNGIVELVKLGSTLQNDAQYVAFGDRFERMKFFVHKYAAFLAQCGEIIQDHCRRYRHTYRKSHSLASYYQDKAALLHMKFLNDGSLSAADYVELLKSSNKALRHLPLMDDSANIVAMLEIYIYRAQVSFDYGEYRSTNSDLIHAFAALQRIYALEVIQELTEELDLHEMLLTMLSLQTKSLVELGEGKRALRRQSELNVEDIFQLFKAIEALNRLLESYNFTEGDSNGKQDNYFVSPKLQFTQTAGECGRYFQAIQPISKGEKVLQERASQVLIFTQHLFKYCNYCYKPMITFWPCKGCAELGFCSAKCSDIGYEEFHKYECGLYRLMLGGTSNYYALLHVFRSYARHGAELELQCEERTLREPFDVDEYFQTDAFLTKSFTEFTPEERSIECRALSSLISNRNHRNSSREICMSVLSLTVVHALIYKGLLPKETLTGDEDHLARLLEHIANGLMRTCTNGFCWSKEEVGKREFTKLASCLSFVASFFNHSCEPNVHWQFTPSGGINQMVTCRDIATGEALTISYGPKASPLTERQQKLRDDYCFYCHCEACRKDAANSASTLRCQSRTSINCAGPLVVQGKFQACLMCGHCPRDVSILAQIVERQSKNFQRTIRSLGKKDYRQVVKFIPIVGCILANHNSEKPTDKSLKNETLGCLQRKKPKQKVINRNRITRHRLAKLEDCFYEYASLIYGGSHHLLDKCTQLLEVYQEMAILERGLMLVVYIDQCLDTIFPQWICSSQIKLLYMLDYSASFYHRLAIQWEFNIAQLIAHFYKGDASYDDTAKPPQSADWYWHFCARLNTKLVQVLEYDLVHRGDFFPLLNARLRQSERSSQDEQDDESEADIALGSDEECYRECYQACEIRLGMIERLQQQVE